MNKHLIQAFSLLCTAATVYGADLVSIKAESAKNFYNGDKLSVVDGVFTIPAQSKVKAPGGYFYLEKAPVNLDSPYRLSGEFKSVSGESGNRIRFGLILLTAKTSPLNARSINIVPDSETVLLADCSAADKKVKIKDGANWKQDGISLIAFNIDPTGKQRDLPNNHLSKGLITAVRPVSDGVELELNAPVGQYYPAGTPVRAHRASWTYFYAGATAAALGNDWKKIEVVIPPGAIPAATLKRWWFGTKYAMIVVESIDSKKGVMFRNLTLTELPATK